MIAWHAAVPLYFSFARVYAKNTPKNYTYPALIDLIAWYLVRLIVYSLYSQPSTSDGLARCECPCFQQDDFTFRKIVFAFRKIIFTFSKIVFTICAEKVCYKLCNGRYKLSNTCYKLCNAYYKLCNKNYLKDRKNYQAEKKKYLAERKNYWRDNLHCLPTNQPDVLNVSPFRCNFGRIYLTTKFYCPRIPRIFVQASAVPNLFGLCRAQPKMSRNLHEYSCPPC